MGGIDRLDGGVYTRAWESAKVKAALMKRRMPAVLSLLLLVGLVLILPGCLASDAQEEPAAGGVAGSGTSVPLSQQLGRIVYFTVPGSPSSQLSLLPEEAVRGLQGEVVNSFSELQAEIADAIVLDSSSFDEVPSGWLAEQYDLGTVLVALNFPGEQLKMNVRVPDEFGAFGALPDAAHAVGGLHEGVPYASIISRSALGLYAGSGYDAGQRHVHVEAGQPELFLGQVLKRIEDAAGMG